jgi:hypothetical protein
MKEFGKMKISEAMPYLKSVAKVYNLKLNKLNEFKMAKTILANLYCNNF